jgi:D-serine deaminase-like pyridoxal phosphate-dependent protein
VETPKEAAALARQVLKHSPALRFKGIQAYHGGIQHVRDPQERLAAVAEVARKAKAAVHGVMEVAGVDPHMTVTGGGTGTYRLDAGSGVFTEVQPGEWSRLGASLGFRSYYFRTKAR